MITSTSGAQSTNAAASFDFSNTTSTASVDSFAQQLMTAIEGYLSNSTNGSQLEIDIQGPQGQNSGNNSQFVVTLTNTAGNPPASTPSATTPAVSTPPAAAAAAATPEAVTPASTTSAAEAVAAPASNDVNASTTAAPLTAAELANMTPDQAYWAEQPPAIQALQNMAPDQRAAAAQSLADQGYSIDVPIIVWGWDPMATMVQREIDGYTWAPAVQTSGTQSGPGLNAPGSPGYDPSDPPADAIPVTTAFAIGTNGQDPWIQNINTTTGTVGS